ncbi:unnamed protein product [Blepharisma stoltei]|uniref:Band 7 domain-containing protein n=1 Tax=Blepharisma stoltei TaxID=1481888 RepID=A0AAU9IVP5_9CILI|nr:unnamed protein product [Blepharisma stoltei]
MDRKTLIILGLIGAALLVTAILLAVSFDSVEYTEYGLDYSSISKSVGTSPYLGGIYLLGIGHSFIKFPRTVLTIDFSNDAKSDRPQIESRTSDGLEVLLEISFQYELISANLYDLYMNYELKYQYVIENIAIDTLTDQATKYTAYDFFMNRAKIGTEMQQALDAQLRNKTYTSVPFFQLRDVDLPDAFESAIQLSEVKKQDIQKANAEMNKIKVEIETKLLKANLNKSVTINLANGEAEAIKQNNEAEVNGFNATEMAAIYGYQALKESTNMTNPDLLNYLKASIVENYDGDKLVVSFKK